MVLEFGERLKEFFTRCNFSQFNDNTDVFNILKYYTFFCRSLLRKIANVSNEKVFNHYKVDFVMH